VNKTNYTSYTKNDKNDKSSSKRIKPNFNDKTLSPESNRSFESSNHKSTLTKQSIKSKYSATKSKENPSTIIPVNTIPVFTDRLASLENVVSEIHKYLKREEDNNKNTNRTVKSTNRDDINSNMQEIFKSTTRTNLKEKKICFLESSSVPIPIINKINLDNTIIEDSNKSAEVKLA